MDVYTNLKIIRPKEQNQELSNYHRRNQQSISHIWPPNTHHIRQGNQKDPRAPQDHLRDTLSSFHGQTPQKCGASHIFFLFQWETFPTHNIKEYLFHISPSMQQQSKIRNHIGNKASEDQI